MPSSETIVAVSSPPGSSARAIVRLSGPEAIVCAEKLFVSQAKSQKPKAKIEADWHITLGSLTVPAFVAPVPCMLMMMRGPRSYTREDVVEFHVPGSPPVVSGVLEAVLASGARLARPGEFTERAYLSGRIDLAQAEAVMKLIHAAGEDESRLALGELTGALSKRVAAVAEQLTEALTQVELAIDFSEEDLVPAGEDKIAREVSCALGEVEGLRRSEGAAVAFSERARIAVVGRANAGKSSLFNRLVGRAAAIVTPVPGTTRDVLEEETDIEGARVLLVDTAGERPKAEGERPKAEPDPDEEALVRARSERERADLLLLVIDGSEPLSAVDAEFLDAVSANPKSKIQNPKSSPACLLVLNKSDLPAAEKTERPDISGRGHVVEVSCLTGAGLDALRAEIREALLGRGVRRPAQRFLLTLRQLDSLRLAAECLARARDASGLELIADDLRGAINHLRSLTRPLAAADLLDRIFSRFCIGK